MATREEQEAKLTEQQDGLNAQFNAGEITKKEHDRGVDLLAIEWDIIEQTHDELGEDMNAEAFCNVLWDALQGFEAEGNLSLEIDLIRMFGEAGLMTNDQGIVVKLGDGSEYQLTVVRSK